MTKRRQKEGRYRAYRASTFTMLVCALGSYLVPALSHALLGATLAWWVYIFILAWMWDK